VGENLNNQVIDRLGSTGWTLAEGSPIIKNNRVEFVVLCVDPFDRSIPPGLKELIQQPTKFQLVYKDDLSAVFKVNNSG
jgi:hypothetical protein